MFIEVTVKEDQSNVVLNKSIIQSVREGSTGGSVIALRLRDGVKYINTVDSYEEIKAKLKAL